MIPQLIAFLLATFSTSSPAARNSCTMPQLCAELPFIKISPLKSDVTVMNLFQETKDRMTSVISSLIHLSEGTRKSLQIRVSPVGLKILDRKGSEHAAAFNSDDYVVYAGAGLSELSKANLINLFAHELAHSIDPGAVYYTLTKMGDVYIQNDEKINPSARAGYTILTDPVPDGHEYGNLIAPIKALSLTQDRYNEALSDWFAAQVIAVYLGELPKSERRQAAIASVMDLLGPVCAKRNYDRDASTLYPTSRVRIEGIFFGNADIFRSAGCDF